MQVLPLGQLARWAAAIGGALSGAALALLMLGPALGLPGWHNPPPGREGAPMQLPASPVAARAPARRPAASLGATTLGALPVALPVGAAATPVVTGTTRTTVSRPRQGVLTPVRAHRPVAPAPQPAPTPATPTTQGSSVTPTYSGWAAPKTSPKTSPKTDTTSPPAAKNTPSGKYSGWAKHATKQTQAKQPQATQAPNGVTKATSGYSDWAAYKKAVPPGQAKKRASSTPAVAQPVKTPKAPDTGNAPAQHGKGHQGKGS